ncbi:IS3 family transposase [Metamycoplasma canadense]
MLLVSLIRKVKKVIHKYIKYYNEKRIITKLKGMTSKK